MFLLILLSAFFLWLIIRELVPSKKSPNKFDGFSLVYIVILASLAFICARAPYKYWQLETLLGTVAAEIAEVESVDFHCNSLFESIFYEGYSYGSFTMAGLAFPDERKIIFQYPWCKRLMSYLENPMKADQDQRFSLPLFTHEVMHIRGELVEQKTECQAIQRNYSVALIFGVPDAIAQQNAVQYYQDTYPRHAYFTKDCARGKRLDERLSNPIW